MYRCSYCKKNAPLRQSRLLVTEYRQVGNADNPRKEIAKETPACEECHARESALPSPSQLTYNLESVLGHVAVTLQAAD